ncbi:MAG: GntR family transcriptional regulator [Roseobacter sp.]
MARSNRLFKRSYNLALDQLTNNADVTSLSDFARSLGVSRTTARKIAIRLVKNGLLSPDLKAVAPTRAPLPRDYFSDDEARPTEQEIEIKFMNWILHDRVLPGTKVSEATLVRRFGVSASTVREFLIRLSRFGFIRKEPYHHWVLDGFSDDYAREVMEFRRIFELRAVKQVLILEKDHAFWDHLEDIAQQHLQLKANLDRDYLKMPALDAQFHALFSQASGARLLPVFGEAISLIFHYHYHHFWDETSRFERAQSAIEDHLGIIDAFRNRNLALATERMETHLKNAQSALEDTF